MVRVYRRHLGDDYSLDVSVFEEAVRHAMRETPDRVGAMARMLLELVPRFAEADAQPAAIDALRLVCRLNEDDLYEFDTVASLVRDIAAGVTTSVPRIKRRLHPHVRPWRGSPRR